MSVKRLKQLAVLACTLLILSGCSSEPNVSNAWIRQPPPTSTVSAAYLTINNPSADPLSVVSATSPSFGAIEFHETQEHDGQSRMRRHKTLSIPARGELKLQPGSYHLMLFRPQQEFVLQAKHPFTLNLADGRTLNFEAEIRRE